MAKRGRPSKKVLKKRKELKKKSNRLIFIAVLIIIGLIIFCYFTLQ